MVYKINVHITREPGVTRSPAWRTFNKHIRGIKKSSSPPSSSQLESLDNLDPTLTIEPGVNPKLKIVPRSIPPGKPVKESTQIPKKELEKQIFEKIEFTPYGVTGNIVKGNEPDTKEPAIDFTTTALVDAAGLPFIDGTLTILGAGGSSEELYKFIGIITEEQLYEYNAFNRKHKDSNSKPDLPTELHIKFPQVLHFIERISDAQIKKYTHPINNIHYYVIHAAGPDFRKDPYKNYNTHKILNILKVVYQNIFLQLCNNIYIQILRLLPMSMGIFAGEINEAKKPGITMMAIRAAIEELDEETLNKLSKKQIILCVYDNKESNKQRPPYFIYNMAKQRLLVEKQGGSVRSIKRRKISNVLKSKKIVKKRTLRKYFKRNII